MIASRLSDLALAAAATSTELPGVDPAKLREAGLSWRKVSTLRDLPGWLAAEHVAQLARPGARPRSVDSQFAELGSFVPAWSATVIPACFSAQSSAKSATSSHPSMAGSRCGPSNSTISVTDLDL